MSLNNGVSNTLASSYTFSTVAPIADTTGGASVFMDGTDSRNWVSMPTTAPALAYDASAHNFVYALKDVATANGISAPSVLLDAQIFKFTGFGAGDFIYLDAQGGKIPQASFVSQFAVDASTGEGAITMPGDPNDSNTGFLNLYFMDKTTLNALTLANGGTVIAG